MDLLIQLGVLGLPVSIFLIFACGIYRGWASAKKESKAERIRNLIRQDIRPRVINTPYGFKPDREEVRFYHLKTLYRILALNSSSGCEGPHIPHVNASKRIRSPRSSSLAAEQIRVSILKTYGVDLADKSMDRDQR